MVEGSGARSSVIWVLVLGVRYRQATPTQALTRQSLLMFLFIHRTQGVQIL
jgi:hypothetical protein